MKVYTYGYNNDGESVTIDTGVETPPKTDEEILYELAENYAYTRFPGTVNWSHKSFDRRERDRKNAICSFISGYKAAMAKKEENT